MNWFRPKPVIVVPEPPLEESVIKRALATDIENLPVFQAVMQVIGAKIIECQEAAIKSVATHGIVASEVGGMQTLIELRDQLVQLRAEGKQG